MWMIVSSLIPLASEIDKVITDLRQQKFDVEEVGDLSDYLGVKVEHLQDGYIKLSQPHLIDQIIKDMHFKDNTKPKDTPSLISRVLQRDEGGKPFDEIWSYPSIIGKLNFLEKSSRLDIAYSVHQCARFSSAPKLSHSKAVNHLVHYLKRH